MLLSAEQERTFVTEGAVVLPSAVAPKLRAAALAAIEDGAQGDDPVVQALYHSSPLKALFDGLLGGSTAPVSGAQIAMRQPTAPEQHIKYMDGSSPSDWNGCVQPGVLPLSCS